MNIRKSTGITTSSKDQGAISQEAVSQEAINQEEWQNPENWSTVYFSKRDNRASVPKRNPKQGWTINFAHPKGARWIYYLMVIFFLIGVTIGTGLGFFLSLLFASVR